MPLHWTIDSQQQLFVAVCDGDVELAEVHEMIDAAVGCNVLGYRKMFDGTHGDTHIDPLDFLGIGVRLRSLESQSDAHGPLAIVLPDDKHLVLSRLLGILAATKRPLRVFKDAGLARKWLDAVAGGEGTTRSGPARA
jgi:hypothetical protein